MIAWYRNFAPFSSVRSWFSLVIPVILHLLPIRLWIVMSNVVVEIFDRSYPVVNPLVQLFSFYGFIVFNSSYSLLEWFYTWDITRDGEISDHSWCKRLLIYGKLWLALSIPLYMTACCVRFVSCFGIRYRSWFSCQQPGFPHLYLLGTGGLDFTCDCFQDSFRDNINRRSILCHFTRICLSLWWLKL